MLLDWGEPESSSPQRLLLLSPLAHTQSLLNPVLPLLLPEPFRAAPGTCIFHERWKALAVDGWEKQRCEKMLPLGRHSRYPSCPPKVLLDAEPGPRLSLRTEEKLSVSWCSRNLWYAAP